MAVLTVQGVCVGLKNETVEYMKDGKLDSFQSISASFADINGQGEPVDVDLSEKQFSEFKAFEQYRFPVRVGIMNTKKGAFCRISMVDGGRLERLGQPSPTPPATPK